MPVMLKIDGHYVNANTVKRIVPHPGSGTVMVSLEHKHWAFQVPEGSEEEWAADLAGRLGPVADTSATPVERG